MVQVKGSRPGGRAADVVRRAHTAVRELVDEGHHEASFAAIAERSGVHFTTLYRRWGTPRMLMLDALVQHLDEGSALPATGSLEQRLRSYADSLAAATLEPRGLTFLRILIAATGDAEAADGQARDLIRPRLEAYQQLIDATGTSDLTAEDLVNGLLAPIYLRALLSAPIQPGSDELARIVHNLNLVAQQGNGAPPV